MQINKKDLLKEFKKKHCISGNKKINFQIEMFIERILEVVERDKNPQGLNILFTDDRTHFLECVILANANIINSLDEALYLKDRTIDRLIKERNEAYNRLNKMKNRAHGDNRS